MKQFRTFNLSAQLPYFMKTYEEYATLQNLSKKFKKHAKAISDKADTDILAMNLPADHLTNDIFGKSKILKTTAKIYDAARRRVDEGNPPGKPGSIGDAINWLLLLEHVPDEEPLFIVTEDSDFYSQFDDKAISPFLKHEWSQTKQSAVKAYRTLNELFDEHYDGVHVSYDEEKKDLVDALESCGSFAATHSVVAKLEKYKYYSLQEAKSILDALQANDQFRMIRGDSGALYHIMARGNERCSHGTRSGNSGGNAETRFYVDSTRRGLAMHSTIPPRRHSVTFQELTPTIHLSCATIYISPAGHGRARLLQGGARDQRFRSIVPPGKNSSRRK